MSSNNVNNTNKEKDQDIGRSNNDEDYNNMEENQKTLRITNKPAIIREASEKIIDAFASHPKTVSITDLFTPLTQSNTVNADAAAADSIDDGNKDSLNDGDPGMDMDLPGTESNHDDAVSVLSFSSTKKTITFKESKGIFAEEAQLGIMKVIEEIDEQVENHDSPSILQGLPSDTLHLFQDLIEDKNESNLTEEVVVNESPILHNYASSSVGEVNEDNINSTGEPFVVIQKLTPATSQLMDNTEILNVQDGIINQFEDPVGGKGKDCSDFDVEAQRNQDSDDRNDKPTDGKDNDSIDSNIQLLCSRLCRKIVRFLYHKMKAIGYLVYFCFILICVLVGTAALLYYGFGNPIVESSNASYSWYLLLCARFLTTFMLAILTETLVVDILIEGTKSSLHTCGRFLELIKGEMKGWPLWMIFWGIANFILLYGNAPHVATWISWPKFIEKSIPDLNCLSSDIYVRILVSLIVFGSSVIVKNGAIVTLVGWKKLKMYGSQMDIISKKVNMLSKIADLAEKVEYSKKTKINQTNDDELLLENISTKSFDRDMNDDMSYTEDLLEQNIDKMKHNKQSMHSIADKGTPLSRFLPSFVKLGKRNVDHILNKEVSSKHLETEALLGDDWEEPDTDDILISKNATSIKKILEFREHLHYIRGDFPLSRKFGKAGSRKQCMKSAVRLFKQLYLHNPTSPVINFKTVAIIALDNKGGVDKDEIRSLIAIFRPDREGNITLLKFLQGCDSIYKDIRMFSATIINSTQMDDAIESLTNIIFYLVLSIVILRILEMFPFAITFVTTVILPCAFLFKAAVSIWFEGLLLMFLRQPYDIGDRIAISNPEKDTNALGSTTWFVDKFSIFSTTVRSAATNEVATYNNGYLAGTRIINAARSPKAQVFIHLKFGIDVSFEKVKIFKSSIEKFVQDRPQEWFKLLAFRATTIQADLGYIGYVLVLQHVEAWQNTGPIRESQANLSSFCLEVCKQMQIRFVSPPMPVQLYVDGFDENKE